LKQTITLKTTVPEMISLTNSFQTMLEQMRSVIREVDDMTNELEVTGTELSGSSDDALAYSKQLVESINVVKDGALHTASSSEASLNSFHHMKGNIDQLAENMDTVFERSE